MRLLSSLTIKKSAPEHRFRAFWDGFSVVPPIFVLISQSTPLPVHHGDYTSAGYRLQNGDSAPKHQIADSKIIFITCHYAFFHR
jgi:hypothetical protein